MGSQSKYISFAKLMKYSHEYMQDMPKILALKRFALYLAQNKEQAISALGLHIENPSEEYAIETMNLIVEFKDKLTLLEIKPEDLIHIKEEVYHVLFDKSKNANYFFNVFYSMPKSFEKHIKCSKEFIILNSLKQCATFSPSYEKSIGLNTDYSKTTTPDNIRHAHRLLLKKFLTRFLQLNPTPEAIRQIEKSFDVKFTIPDFQTSSKQRTLKYKNSLKCSEIF